MGRRLRNKTSEFYQQLKERHRQQRKRSEALWNAHFRKKAEAADSEAYIVGIAILVICVVSLLL